jgi:hypothetical protein
MTYTQPPNAIPLLPCPFTGREAFCEKRNDKWVIGCMYDLCGFELVAAYSDKDQAIEAWNTRANRSPESDGLIEKLENAKLASSPCKEIYNSALNEAITIVLRHFTGGHKEYCSTIGIPVSECSVCGESSVMGERHTESKDGEAERNECDCLRRPDSEGMPAGLKLASPANQGCEISDVEEESWQALNETLAKRNYIGKARTEFVDEMWEAIRPFLCTTERDRSNIGYLIVATIANNLDQHTWEDEWREFYKPENWFGSHRAAAAFLTEKMREHKPVSLAQGVTALRQAASLSAKNGTPNLDTDLARACAEVWGLKWK